MTSEAGAPNEPSTGPTETGPTETGRTDDGLDLARAGGLTVTSKGATKKVPVAGAVRWS